MKNKDGKHKHLSSRQLVSTWRRVLLFFIIHSSLCITPLFADPIDDPLGRILPHNGDARKFEWTVTGGNTQQFTLSCNGKKVTVSDSDNIAVGFFSKFNIYCYSLAFKDFVDAVGNGHRQFDLFLTF